MKKYFISNNNNSNLEYKKEFIMTIIGFIFLAIFAIYCSVLLFGGTITFKFNFYYMICVVLIILFLLFVIF